MSATTFIAGDWGTTHLRLFLCDENGNQIASKIGPGAVEVRGEFASVFDALIAEWRKDSGALGAILCGMVGSRIGWTETSYVPAPIDPAQLAKAVVQLRGGSVRIVPGLSCRNRLGAPDLMRGEETQVLGAVHLEPELRRGRHLLCLPGTHTKWVVIEDGCITEFLTAPTGELFALISRQSVLVHNDPSIGSEPAAFDRGLAEFARDPRVQLLHRLFQCRSRWMTGELAPESTASYLSGLLVACDICGAVDLLAEEASVRVIGSVRLTDVYARGFAALGRQAREIDGEAAALAGLARLYSISTSSKHG